MNYKNRSGNISTVSLVTFLLLFTLISCNNVRKEPGQAQQLPVLPARQFQPESGNAEPIQFTDNKTVGQPSAVQNSAEVMLNPPHGQPFHRCDIPVGAPLTSQPASTDQQPANNQVQTATPQPSASAPSLANNPYAPTIENAGNINPSQVRNTTTAASGSKPRLNPPHGQPFHRCDIPVGSPLPNTP